MTRHPSISSLRRPDGSFPPLAGGSGPTLADPQLSQQIANAKAEVRELWVKADKATRELNADPAACADLNSPKQRAATEANEAYNAACARADQLELNRAGAVPDGNGPQPTQGGATRAESAGTQSPTVENVREKPGAWLSAVLATHGTDAEHIRRRMKHSPVGAAAVVPMTTENAPALARVIQPESILIDLLTPRSVAIASGIPILRIDGTEVKIPRFIEAPEAAWTEELQPLPLSAPGIENVEIKPGKVGLVSTLSVELWEDLTPLKLSMIQTQIIRAVTLAFDRGMLFGNGIGDEPLGIANEPGATQISAPFVGLRPFAQAIAALIGNNARPGALVMNPLDLGVLLEMTEFNGDTNSNVPLWRNALNNADGEAFNLTLPYMGIPIWPTPAAPRGLAVIYDPTTILAVIRREADITVDPFYDFRNGAAAMRSYLRGDVLSAQPDGTVRIGFTYPTTGQASNDTITSADTVLENGDAIRFEELTGGAPLASGTTYYVRDRIGDSFKVSTTPTGPALDLTSNMTAGTVRKA